MKVVSFVEGVRLSAGGVGLVGVPLINHALARRGHQVIMNVCGRMIPTARELIERGEAGDAAGSGSGSGLEVRVHPAWGRWAFSPSLAARGGAIVREANFIMLHSLYSFPVALGFLLAHRYQKPYILWPHGVLAPFQRGISHRRKRIYDVLLARRILGEANALVFSAKGEREETMPLRLKTPSVVIPHGIDADQFSTLPPRGSFRRKYLNGHDGPMLLYLGRLNAKKGLDVLIEAMRLIVTEMPQTRLAIVGSGDPPQFSDHVKSWIKHCGLERSVAMTGLLLGQEKLEALADADVCVLPSRAENFGFAMFEAMASRVPVVISDSINMAGEVEKHAAGFVARGEPREIGTAALTLLRDEGTRKEMGENGFRLAQSYSWGSVGERVERTLQCICRGLPLPEDLRI